MLLVLLTLGWVVRGSTELRSAARIVEDSQEESVMFNLIGFVVFGLVVGVLARLLKPGKQNLSLVATLLLGLTGSVIGGVVASLLGTGDIFELNVLGSIVAVIAALLLVGVAEGIFSRGKRGEVR
ncbi:MAG: GlsB/YeaQ/YmgE family stress response membrane protein [Pseudonocardiaceae bacterium]